MVRRYVDAVVRADLEAKMVFVAGHRQVGKTTPAKGILSDPVGYR